MIKILVLFLMMSCATEPLNIKIYSLGNDGLYRSQSNEFIPIKNENINDYFCVQDQDLIKIIERLKNE